MGRNFWENKNVFVTGGAGFIGSHGNHQATMLKDNLRIATNMIEAVATEQYDKPEPVNIGMGFEITIRDLAKLICQLMQFRGEIVWDKTKPDGQPRRILDIIRARKEFGFVAKTPFEKGLRHTIDWYLASVAKK